jgi:hypothetical protein
MTDNKKGSLVRKVLIGAGIVGVLAVGSIGIGGCAPMTAGGFNDYMERRFGEPTGEEMNQYRALRNSYENQSEFRQLKLRLIDKYPHSNFVRDNVR